MRLADYLDRVDVGGEVRPDLATLRRLHRAHVEAIPYENLDVQLRRPVTRSASDAFAKIVGRRRGGWCYEMNGLLSWALEEIGFSVTRLAGGVMRETAGDDVVGNHLVLIVDLDCDRWLCDAGFGDGLIEPVALREGPFRIGPLACALERIEGGWWRYRNDPMGSAPSFDFHEDVGDERLLESRCHFLQTDPASPFMQNLVVQRWTAGVHWSLRGRVLTRIDNAGKTRRLVADPEEMVRILREGFGLDAPEAASLWPAIVARHETVFPTGI